MRRVLIKRFIRNVVWHQARSRDRMGAVSYNVAMIASVSGTVVVSDPELET